MLVRRERPDLHPLGAGDTRVSKPCWLDENYREDRYLIELPKFLNHAG